ncbi:MAG: hypothetical protein Q8L84_14310 [Hyphomonas sp.]|nr:hypothetical protein [Hyphomonas sp.]
MTTADSASLNAAGASGEGGWKEWRRPRVPETNHGSGLAGGGVLILLGLVAFLIPPLAGEQYGPGGMLALLLMIAPLAGALLFAGMWIVSLCLILREIRQAAYEAALRAGEVETRTR